VSNVTLDNVLINLNLEQILTSRLTVRLGNLDLSKKSDTLVEAEVKKVHVHPSYKFGQVFP